LEEEKGEESGKIGDPGHLLDINLNGKEQVNT
jgi:hypothetical protein